VLGASSLAELESCHPKLQLLIREVDRRLSASKRPQKIDLKVIQGHRGKEDQHQAFLEGKSKQDWPNSRHNADPSTAVDIAPYPLDWNDADMFMLLSGYALAVADDLGIEVEVGALWAGHWDRPHIQLTMRELGKAA
jgi:peptidoglycan L-alanyl-D-glutamate endopeptidase CwlK